MAFSWSNIVAGDTKVLADHANTLRNNANTLITLMTANAGKCSNYSCSSLGTIPDAVSAGTTIVYGSWLDGMKASIDRIDTNKYCAAKEVTRNTGYKGTDRTGHQGTYNSGLWGTNHSGYHSSNLTSNNNTRCSTYLTTYHGSFG